MIYIWVWDLTVPMHLVLNWRALYAPYQFKGVLLLCRSSRWPPDLYSSCLLGPKDMKEPRYTCLSEALASHSHRMWAEVSFSAPHLLHNGLSDSPIWWSCLLRVLCPVRRPVTTLDFVLLKTEFYPRHPDRSWMLRLYIVSLPQNPEGQKTYGLLPSSPFLLKLKEY